MAMPTVDIFPFLPSFKSILRFRPCCCLYFGLARKQVATRKRAILRRGGAWLLKIVAIVVVKARCNHNIIQITLNVENIWEHSIVHCQSHKTMLWICIILWWFVGIAHRYLMLMNIKHGAIHLSFANQTFYIIVYIQKHPRVDLGVSQNNMRWSCGHALGHLHDRYY